MKSFQKVILVLALQTLVLPCYAITALQYCEKLHAKRPAGVTTSYELLNADAPTSTVISYAVGIGVDAHGNAVYAHPVYSLSVTNKKSCRNGVFIFQKMTRIQWLNDCSYSQSNCAPQGTTCEDESGNPVTCM